MLDAQDGQHAPRDEIRDVLERARTLEERGMEAIAAPASAEVAELDVVEWRAPRGGGPRFFPATLATRPMMWALERAMDRV